MGGSCGTRHGCDVAGESSSATVAYAVTPTTAVKQIKEYLRWLSKRDMWHAETELENVELRKIRVKIRPRHYHEHHEMLLPTTVELRLPNIIGKLNRHSWLSALPTLGLRFIVDSERGIQRIAEEQVKASLANSTVQELVQYLGIGDVQIQEISIPRPPAEFKIHQNHKLPVLEALAQPLGKANRREKIHPVFERDEEIRELTKIISGPGKSLLLVGDEGVGKSSILTHAARHMVKNAQHAEGPTPPHRIWATSAGRLIAGMKYLGQWEERCEEVIDELGNISGWLCIDSLHDLILTGGKEPRGSLAAFFLPFIRHGQLRLICEASPSQLVAAERMLPEFVEALSKVSVKPLPEEKRRQALDQATQVIAEQHQLQFDSKTAVTALQLVQRFEPYKAPLAPATQLLRRLASSARKRKCESVSIDDVYQSYAEKTGLPLDVLLDSIPLRFDDLVKTLQQEVVGQEKACCAVANLVSTYKAGLNAPKRPLGVLLFCGPTGVGKTQLAKTLGQYLFGHSRDDTLIRLDMSEFGGPSASDRLLCKPDRTPSNWIQRVRKQPFCVLLLDEIEKANSQVFDVIMGLLDEGRLTDPLGRVTDFTSTIVIMTSNLGVTTKQEIGFSDSEGSRFETRVREFFRPEFFNRIDAVTPFEKLSREDCRRIIQMELKSLQKRDGLARRNIVLDFDDSVVEELLKTGFDASLGARPLQRNLEKLVTSRLARYLAKNHLLRDRRLYVRHQEETGIEISHRE